MSEDLDVIREKVRQKYNIDPEKIIATYNAWCPSDHIILDIKISGYEEIPVMAALEYFVQEMGNIKIYHKELTYKREETSLV